VISFPNCKINLGLNVIAKRSDGFHNLETVFVPVPFEDCLEVERATDVTSLTITGLAVEGELEDNLVMKAYELLRSRFELPAVEIRLHKQIPSGAGLGGGSSDAAFTLRLLNHKFNLQLSQKDLLDLAGILGSDCPFFIINSPCIGTERGNVLEPVEMTQLEGIYGIIVVPALHISSAWAFQQVTVKSPAYSIKEVIARPLQDWKQHLINDFEKPVFDTHPQLKEIKDQLYEAGAIYASLSGSGSALYGLFSDLPTIRFPSPHIVKTFTFHSAER
jgi:4-diphosphocytidyl-2-C-methyl-D-erythritol kinase